MLVQTLLIFSYDAYYTTCSRLSSVMRFEWGNTLSAQVENFLVGNNENMKVPRHCLLWRGICFHLVTSLWNSVHWIEWSKQSEIPKSLNSVRFPRVPSKLCIGIFILKTDDFFHPSSYDKCCCDKPGLCVNKDQPPTPSHTAYVLMKKK